MEIIIRAVISMLISIVIGLLLWSIEGKNKRESIKNMKKEHVILRLPNIFLWAGGICSVFFTALLMLSYNAESAVIWVKVTFCVFILLGIFLMLMTRIWKIEIFRQKDYFIYRSFFRTREIRYRECQSYKLTAGNLLVIQTGRRKLYLDLRAVNFDVLLIMLEQYNVKNISKKTRR